MPHRPFYDPLWWRLYRFEKLISELSPKLGRQQVTSSGADKYVSHSVTVKTCIDSVRNSIGIKHKQQIHRLFGEFNLKFTITVLLLFFEIFKAICLPVVGNYGIRPVMKNCVMHISINPNSPCRP